LAQASFLAYEVFDTGFSPHPSAYLAADAAGDPALSVTDNAIYAAAAAADASGDEEVAKAVQTDLLRDIFGNPYRPVAVDKTCLSWNGGTIPKLAQAIYKERAFDRLPILADALEDAGCDNADMLAHCRQQGPHVRGCYVVDLILDKK